MLTDAHVPHTQIHLGNAHLAIDCRFSHYIVTVRDPINRTISAFNWRHTDGGGATTSPRRRADRPRRHRPRADLPPRVEAVQVEVEAGATAPPLRRIAGDLSIGLSAGLII